MEHDTLHSVTSQLFTLRNGKEGKLLTHHARKACVGKWSSSHPRRFTCGGRVPGTHWVRGWVDLWGDLDVLERGKISCRISNRGSSSP